MRTILGSRASPSIVPGSVVYFARTERQPVVVAHRNAGGRAVFLRGDDVVLAVGSRQESLADAGRRLPRGVPLDSFLAAIAATWCMHREPASIAASVAALTGDLCARLAAALCRYSRRRIGPGLCRARRFARSRRSCSPLNAGAGRRVVSQFGSQTGRYAGYDRDCRVQKTKSVAAGSPPACRTSVAIWPQ